MMRRIIWHQAFRWSTARSPPEYPFVTVMPNTKTNGIFYPDLKLPEQTTYHLGKYANLRLDFMKRHRRGTYMTLLSEGKLNEYLYEIDEQVYTMLDNIILCLVKERGIDEELKSCDPIKWVAEMNNIKASAEETVFNEIIYR